MPKGRAAEGLSGPATTEAEGTHTFFSQTLDDISEKITLVFISTKVRIKSRISVSDIGAFFPLRGLELGTEVSEEGRRGRNRLVGGAHPVLVGRVQVGHELL